jgi:hypothetical protein
MVASGGGFRFITSSGVKVVCGFMVNATCGVSVISGSESSSVFRCGLETGPNSMVIIATSLQRLVEVELEALTSHYYTVT